MANEVFNEKRRSRKEGLVMFVAQTYRTDWVKLRRVDKMLIDPLSV